MANSETNHSFGLRRLGMMWMFCAVFTSLLFLFVNAPLVAYSLPIICVVMAIISGLSEIMDLNHIAMILVFLTLVLILIGITYLE